MRYFISAIVIGLLLILAATIVEVVWIDENLLSGQVIERVYAPSRISTGSGVVVDSNGKTGVVTTVDSSPEEWIVLVQIGSEAVSCQSTPIRWAQVNKGDQVKVIESRGHLFGLVVSHHIQ